MRQVCEVYLAISVDALLCPPDGIRLSTMRPLLLILAFILSVAAQTAEWKPIKEMSGEIPDHPGITLNVSASEIARGNDLVKLRIRFDFPDGAPYDLFRNNAPVGFDVSSVVRIESRIELNCKTFIVKPAGSSADVYQFNGKKLKSKEVPIAISSGHIFAQYFCEQGLAPTAAPRLKPKP